MRALGFLVIVLALGCNDNKPKGDLPPLHPAKGRLVRGTLPSGAGEVRFQTDDGSTELLINSEVAADGSFEITTMHAISMKKGKGAPAGSYKVTFQPALGNSNMPSAPVVLQKPVKVVAGENDLIIDLLGK